MENIGVPTPGCWNINDIYTPKANVINGKVIKNEKGEYKAPNHSGSHK
jgi:acetolactate synthase-1/2/3 large subunit